MQDFSFVAPVKINFGRQALDELPKLVENRRVLLITGGGSIKAAGIFDQIMAKITPTAAKVIDLSGQRKATHIIIKENIEIAKKSAVDLVIGAGGATVMDMAKIIAFGLRNVNLDNFLSGKVGVTTEKHATTILIPTYPSTGSEVDNLADVESFNGDEHGVLKDVYADYALMNPAFTFSLNKQNTAFSTLVTFIQSSIYYLANDNVISQGFTKTVLKTVLDSYPRVLNDPNDYDARGNIMWASSLGTMTILAVGMNATFPWTLYDLTDIGRRFMGLSYREAVSVVFPYWLAGEAQQHPTAVRRFMLDILNLDPLKSTDELVSQGVCTFQDLLTQGGLPISFSAYLTQPSDTELIEMIAKNPIRGFDQSESLQILKNCFAS